MRDPGIRQRPPSSVRLPRRGAPQVARIAVGFARRPPRAGQVALVNGRPGLLLRDADDVLNVISFTIDDGLITAINVGADDGP